MYDSHYPDLTSASRWPAIAVGTEPNVSIFGSGPRWHGLNVHSSVTDTIYHVLISGL